MRSDPCAFCRAKPIHCKTEQTEQNDIDIKCVPFTCDVGAVLALPIRVPCGCWVAEAIGLPASNVSRPVMGGAFGAQRPKSMRTVLPLGLSIFHAVLTRTPVRSRHRQLAERGIVALVLYVPIQFGYAARDNRFWVIIQQARKPPSRPP